MYMDTSQKNNNKERELKEIEREREREGKKSWEKTNKQASNQPEFRNRYIDGNVRKKWNKQEEKKRKKRKQENKTKEMIIKKTWRNGTRKTIE